MEFINVEPNRLGVVSAGGSAIAKCRLPPARRRRCRPALPPRRYAETAEAEDIWDNLWHHEAHNSTAIEGNTLVLNEVRQLLAEGRAVGNKELKEYMEVEGYGRAARWVYDQAQGAGRWTNRKRLTLHEVRSVHHQAMALVWEVAPHANALPEESPGNWRRHGMKPVGEGMTPPPFTDLDARVADWVRLASALGHANHPTPFPERLARVHDEFEQIHPFLDGNGRTGRLLLNLLLVRLGYPPAIVYKNERTRYLAAMRKADAGDYGPLGELLARAITDNLYRFVVPAVAGPARLVPLVSLVGPSSPVTANALRVAAVRGRLRAQKQPDGAWLSSRSWVEDYINNRYRRA